MDKFSHDIEEIIANLNSNLHDILKDIESQRVQILKKTRSFLIYFGVAFLGSLPVIVSISTNYVLFFLFVFFLIGIIVYYFWIKTAKDLLIDDFNTQVIPHVVKEFLSDAYFNHNTGISESEYIKSDIFRTECDKYSGDSFVSGNFGETFLQFSNLHTKYESGSGKSKRNETIFKGIFLIAESNKRFNNEVYIFPDSAERAFGGIGRWMQEKYGKYTRGEMVYLENPEFEKKFVVYATDPIEARYLLTMSMQEYFLQLSAHIGGRNIHASFIDGRLYLAISGNFELFNFQISMSLLDPKTLKYYCQNLGFILSIIEILDLNTRIWGK